MKQQIASISIGQAAKIFAFISAAVFIGASAIFFVLELAFTGPNVMAEVLPIIFLRCASGYVLILLACVVYNFAARRVGGIIIGLTPVTDGDE